MEIRGVVLSAMLALGCLATQATAAPVVSGGKLVGATNVDVDGILYDVTFSDGSCQSQFDGCDSASDFAFLTLAGAKLATAALMSQVFVGIYDAVPALTEGCEFSHCYVYVPYEVSAGNVLVAVASNSTSEAGDSSTLDGLFPSTLDLTFYGVDAFARFIAADIPEPSSLILLGATLLGSGLARRRIAVSKA